MEKVLVYIAGNPDAYPVEYYDAPSGSYQGLIPELLRKFSQETKYDIQYYEAGREDRREKLASNRQVDLVSGLDGTETIAHRSGGDIALLKTAGGTETVYGLCLLDTAPETLGEELRGYFSGVSQAEKTGMLIEASRQETPRQSAAEAGVFGLALAVFALAAAAALLIRRIRRQRRQIAENEETDSVSGAGSEAFLARRWRNCVDDRNRILCTMVTFYIRAEEGNGSARPDMPEFLRHTAKVLREYAGGRDILARIPGSGFVLLRMSGREEDPAEWLPPVLERIRDASESGRDGWEASVSAGVYPLKADDRDLEEALLRSFRCARAACREGLDFRVCTEALIRELLDERRLRSDLMNGLNRQEFQIYIQFYVDARTGRVIGGEALPYWEHPEKGLLSGDRFLPQLEEAGLLRQLDEIMLDRACAFLEGLHRRGMKHFFLTCRFSGETLSDAEFAKRCGASAGRRFSKDPLYLGITVSGADSQNPAVFENLRLLRETGCLIILEDFDRRLASLFDGSRELFNGLKLSRRMVENMGTPSGPVMPRSLIRMGHDLGVPVLAEGVDTEEQARILRELGCDMVRGGAYCQPLPVWAARKDLGSAAIS